MADLQQPRGLRSVAIGGGQGLADEIRLYGAPSALERQVSGAGRSVSLAGIDDEALEKLVAYAWPGNVRELENVIERAVILAEGERIMARELPANVVDARDGNAPPGPGDLSLKRGRRVVEADLIRRALSATDGNRTKAARLLEISHRALLYKLKDYGIRD